MAKKLVPPREGDSPTRKIEEFLRERVIGQDRAVRELTRAFGRAYAGLKNPEHPIATLAFFGPTGVGKTFTAKVLADFFPKETVWRCQLYQTCKFQITQKDRKRGVVPPKNCPRHQGNVLVERMVIPNIWEIDCGQMSGTMEHAVNDLLGAPAGYVGHGSSPPIFVDGRAPRVVLFDEAEKALLTRNRQGGGSDFVNILLKILENGKIRSRIGTWINFRGSVIILTGNLGSAEIIREFEGQSVGFRRPGEETHRGRGISGMSDREIDAMNERIYSIVGKKAKLEFPPEFINRVDRMVVFHFLTRDELEKILERELKKVDRRVQRAIERGKAPPFVLTVSPEVREFLLQESLEDREYGAKPMIRTIDKRLLSDDFGLAELFLNRMINEGDHLEARIGIEPGEDGTEEETIVFYRLDPDEDPLALQPPKPKKRKPKSAPAEENGGDTDG